MLGARRCHVWQKIAVAVTLFSLFLTAGVSFARGENGAAAPRRPEIVVEVEVPGPVQQVFRLWTTKEGVARFLSPAARIDPRVGGPYELAFAPAVDPDGSSYGSKGCRVLEFESLKRLAFEWPAFLAWQSPDALAGPPLAPELRAQLTTVVVEFEAHDSDPQRTIVRLSHRGFRSGARWRQAEKYFWTAWTGALGRLAAQFIEEGERNPEG